MAYLANAEVADFNELKGALQATQGNLSVHLRKLEDAGYVAIEKSFLGRKPLDARASHRRRPKGLQVLPRRSGKSDWADRPLNRAFTH